MRAQYPGTVSERLARKLDILRSWRERGLGSKDLYVPNSLRSFAKWHDEELGVYPVGSPNEVSTEHPVHGPLAVEALTLMRALKTTVTKRGNNFRRPTLGEKCRQLKQALQCSERRNIQLVGQFHLFQANIERLERTSSAREQQLEKLSAENAQLIRRIREIESISIVSRPKRK
jgi:cell division protein FtsB